MTIKSLRESLEYASYNGLSDEEYIKVIFDTISSYMQNKAYEEQQGV